MARLKSSNTISATAQLNLRTAEALFFVNEALFEATQEVIGFDTVETAKALCPVLDKATKERFPGENRESIDSSVSRNKKGVSARVFTKSGFGGYLELGTKNMAAEPYIFPAFEQNIQKLPTSIKEALGSFVKGSSGKDQAGG